MSFVCDECSDSRSFVETCNATVEDTVARYPKELRGRKDPDMLPILMARQEALITLDVHIAEIHADSIPLINPGIILVRTRRPGRTMTHKILQQYVALFKNNYPNWRRADWKNTILEVCEDGVIISPLPLAGAKRVIAYGGEFSASLEDAMASIRGLFLPASS